MVAQRLGNADFWSAATGRRFGRAHSPKPQRRPVAALHNRSPTF